MRSILLTGVSGFIGNKLANLFHQQGHNVVGIDIVEPPVVPEFRFETVGYGDPDLVGILNSESIDTVIHLGGISSTSMSWQYPLKTYQTNTMETFKLLESMIKHAENMDKLDAIFASTIEVYGGSDIVREFLETDKHNPSTPYSISKSFTEVIWDLHLSQNNINNTILQFTNTYGRKNSSVFFIENLLSSLRQKSKFSVNTPNHVRQFLHVDDHINFYSHLLQNFKPGIYNITSSESINIRSLANMISEKCVKQDLITPIEAQHLLEFSTQAVTKYFLASTKKVTDTLGWKAKISLDQGLETLF